MAASPDVEIRTVDPSDDAAFGDWFAVLLAAMRDLRPGEPDWLPLEQQQLSLPTQEMESVLLAAVDAGTVVGAARLQLRLLDNLHLAEVVLAVVPEARRRGAGRALEAAVERVARERDRTTLAAFVDEPPDREPAARSAALALGWHVAQTEVRRDLDLPLDPARVADLERSCGPYAVDYDVVHWWDWSPEEHLDDLAELKRLMSTDVPNDELDLQEEVWDAARFRRNEERVQAMDRTYVGAGAVHRPTGRMVAFTTMGLPRREPERVYQWETLVAREHRGHRLGTLVKLRALQALAAGSPGSRYITTWNAQENAHMIAVNDALGARTNGLLVAVQKVLS